MAGVYEIRFFGTFSMQAPDGRDVTPRGSKARAVLERYYETRGGLNEGRLRMARAPDGARLIENRRGGRKSVQVTSSQPLDHEALESIRVKLDSAFPFTPILETRVDSSLIGGLVIQVDNTVYDSSLRTRIRQLRDRMRERSLHEIQSGRDRFSHPAGD